jgi:LmbE family N-acetylglucosaminyl deacetylase
MENNAELALIKQDFERLLAMFDPTSGRTWNPSEGERLAYVQIADRSLNALQRVRNLERRKLLREGHVQIYMPESVLDFFREQIAPRVSALRSVLDKLDPEGAFVRQLFDELDHATTKGKQVKGTFETGIEQVQDLIDRNPEWGDNHSFMPDTAFDVIDSPLVLFDPDAWLERANELVAIRTYKQNFLLPSHIRFRLEELNRAYVFGCWLSVLALARAILEYAILDNLVKFGVEPLWPSVAKETRRKEKKLSHLIEDLSPHVPSLQVKMERLRDYGNDYLHPKKSGVSKETLFQRQAAAKDVLQTLVQVVEGLYLARRAD